MVQGPEGGTAPPVDPHTARQRPHHWQVARRTYLLQHRALIVILIHHAMHVRLSGPVECVLHVRYSIQIACHCKQQTVSGPCAI